MSTFSPSAPKLRPLLPATGSAKRPPEPAGELRSNGYVSSACEGCRAHKTKCTGERPFCTACVRRRSVCQYKLTSTRRAKQKFEELQRHRSAHEELLGLMVKLPQRDAVEIFNRIRSGGDAETILSHVQDGSLMLQLVVTPETRLRYDLPYSRDMPPSLLVSGSPYLDSVLYEAAFQRALDEQPHDDGSTESRRRLLAGHSASQEYQSQYITPYHAAVFVEPRLEQVKPSKWTNVLKDDLVMREMLATYFTHDYHLWPILQKDTFLEEMASGKGRPSQFCSALLVNATLACTCYCSKRIPNAFRYWDPEGLGYRFLAEARRLWELETVNGKNHSLASVQAALTINVVYNICGLDKVGSAYGLRAIDWAHEMKLFDGNAHIQCERLRDARNFTAWSLYNFESHLAWHFFRQPLLNKPPSYELPDPHEKPAWYGEIWTRYPLSPSLSASSYGHLFKSTTEFRVILNELCFACFGERESLLPARQAMVFVSRMLEWYKNLPKALTPKYIVLPAHFLINLEYHIVLLTVCQPFTHELFENGLIPKDLVDEAERDINVLIRLYYLRHGFDEADIYLISPLSRLGFMAASNIVDGISQERLDFLRSTLLLSLKGLREQGRNYYIARTVYHILKNQLRSEELRLLYGNEEEDEEAQNSSWLPGEINSGWLPRTVDISDDPTAEGLSALAREFLTLEDEEDSASRQSDTASSPP
ncbi:hypothetical protein ACN47E_005844 [Coniothyrium glycines]